MATAELVDKIIKGISKLVQDEFEGLLRAELRKTSDKIIDDLIIKLEAQLAVCISQRYHGYGLDIHIHKPDLKEALDKKILGRMIC